ncbi:nonsense-mediated mRNA decay factor SMG9 isoform X2 [Petromyzon marinus]|uniref:nonsense-mediated mRNA decay factor SMG9 isoform X2 n=1 Tax=Petromyzon marinus TaxID=7757 RepID=UPI003F722B4F
MGEAGHSQPGGRVGARRRRELWNASPDDSHTQEEADTKEVGAMMRTPIILAKPPADRVAGAAAVGGGGGAEKPVAVLAKPRDDDHREGAPGVAVGGGGGVAAGGGSSPPARAASERPAQPLYHIHNRSSGGGSGSGGGGVPQPPATGGTTTASSSAAVTSAAAAATATTATVGTANAATAENGSAPSAPPRLLLLLQPTERMKHSVKLLDEHMGWCDTAMEMLLDQTDFLVVGVLGPQGVGKSTIMSLLATNSPEDDPRLHAFRSQSQESRERASHHTSGVELFISQERVFFLDTQPVLSASVLDHFINNERKLPQEFSLPHTFVESLQLAALLLTVCHVLLVVQDSPWDTRLYRFLRTAEMLKPSCPQPSHESNSTLGTEDSTEHYPHLVFVQNRAPREDFSPRRLEEMEQTVASLMRHSNLKHRGVVSMPGRAAAAAAAAAGSAAVSLFLLPASGDGDADEKASRRPGAPFSLLPAFRGHSGFPSLVARLRKQVLSSPRPPLTHTTLTEKNWFHFAARIWDAVRKSPLMAEYGRLLA